MTETADNYKALVVDIKAARDTVGISAIEIRPDGTVFIIPVEWEGKGYAVYNPEGKPLGELPVIYGFNNGGSRDWWTACLLAEDGKFLGRHIYSSEGYMPYDLGILEGSRPDRHETFRKHYPGGYRMDFVPSREVDTHTGLKAAYAKHVERNSEEEPK
jgi:hypothetical protein